jgi:hypothetical protein
MTILPLPNERDFYSYFFWIYPCHRPLRQIHAKGIETVVRGTVGVDSGGSFNKLVFFRPIDAPDLPHWVRFLFLRLFLRFLSLALLTL